MSPPRTPGPARNGAARRARTLGPARLGGWVSRVRLPLPCGGDGHRDDLSRHPGFHSVKKQQIMTGEIGEAGAAGAAYPPPPILQRLRLLCRPWPASALPSARAAALDFRRPSIVERKGGGGPCERRLGLRHSKKQVTAAVQNPTRPGDRLALLGRAAQRPSAGVPQAASGPRNATGSRGARGPT